MNSADLFKQYLWQHQTLPLEACMPYCFLDRTGGFWIFEYPDGSSLHLPNTPIHRHLLESLALVSMNLIPDEENWHQRDISVWMNPSAITLIKPTHQPDMLELWLFNGLCVYSHRNEWLDKRLSIQNQ